MHKQIKLTLRLDESLINKAKKYSQKKGKSVSRLVADYFRLLDAETELESDAFPPVVRSLIGCLKDKAVSEKDYYKYLEKKYL